MIATTPRGTNVHYACRAGTSDEALVAGIIGEDEYGLADIRVSGWAIDVGAHIGTVTIALAVDNPHLRIVAVEALPENAALIEQSARLNAVRERIAVECAAAAKDGEVSVPITYGWSRADNQPDNYMSDNRYVGGMVGPNETSTTITCPALSLSAILTKYAIDRVALLKIDCEGCEWYFLDSPALVRVDRIIGELHWGKRGTAKEFRALLEPTHDVTMDDTSNLTHFTATLRTATAMPARRKRS